MHGNQFQRHLLTLPLRRVLAERCFIRHISKIWRIKHRSASTLLLSGWLLVACTAPENKPPEDLLSKSQMAGILTDVHMAEARVARLNVRSTDSANLVYKRLEGEIFKKFGVDTAVYRKSYIFYSSHPADMEAIYQQVTEQLKKKIDTKSTKP